MKAFKPFTAFIKSFKVSQKSENKNLSLLLF